MIRERSRLTKLFLKHIRYAGCYCKVGLLYSLTLFYVCSFHFFLFCAGDDCADELQAHSGRLQALRQQGSHYVRATLRL
jgi:hypothetical protein